MSTREADGTPRTWHVLDNGVRDADVTLLCVHGNPTWSYVWRDLLAKATTTRVRVVAVDHLDMGFSERTGTVRRLGQRISDLGCLTDALALQRPVVTVAHDWGGPISLGWAEEHKDLVAGIILMNTAVHQPAGAPAPRLIRIVRTRWLLDAIAVRTSGFIRGTLALSRNRIPRSVREAYLAPYRTPERRAAISSFVQDIPLEPHHPSTPRLDEVAAGLADLGGTPALLLWGPSDPVFSDRYLHDLEARMPHANVHRYIGASHLLPEDAEVAVAVLAWVQALSIDAAPVPAVERDLSHPRAWTAMAEHRGDGRDAVVEMGAEGVKASISFADLDRTVRMVAAGLAAHGVRKGDRVALLVPPGIDLTVALYACWLIGAVVVVADAGLGARGIGQALKSADPDYLVGIPRALGAARALMWPGRRISAKRMPSASMRALGVETTLPQLQAIGETSPSPEPPRTEDAAAVAFTSGATGPAKGVAYRHAQLDAQRVALAALYGIGQQDRLVAAFAPFALFGPAMGIPSVVPDMDVTSPGSLTADALGAAVEAVGATLVFASPSALANVVATAGGLSQSHREAFKDVRLLLSAGAPVPAEILRSCLDLMPNAEAHTPYGMTEVLPVADITLDGIDAAGEGDGVCVGTPLPTVEVAIDPIDTAGVPTGSWSVDPEVVGEVCIRAPHMKDGYDRLWRTQDLSATPTGWHRSGDMGRFDTEGRLWIEGRLVHAVSTPSGVVTPISVERRLGRVAGVRRAAIVGVGPRGTQQVVAVVETDEPVRRASLATLELVDSLRTSAGIDIAAAFVVPHLPVDKRHNAKIDRSALAAWASEILAGGRMKKP